MNLEHHLATCKRGHWERGELYTNPWCGRSMSFILVTQFCCSSFLLVCMVALFHTTYYGCQLFPPTQTPRKIKYLDSMWWLHYGGIHNDVGFSGSPTISHQSCGARKYPPMVWGDWAVRNLWFFLPDSVERWDLPSWLIFSAIGTMKGIELDVGTPCVKCLKLLHDEHMMGDNSTWRQYVWQIRGISFFNWNS